MCKFVYAHQETKSLFLLILVHMCFLQLNYFIISIYFKKVHAWNNCQLESRNKNTVFDLYLNCICCTCIMIANQRPFCHLQVKVYHNRKVHVTGKFVRFFFSNKAACVHVLCSRVSHYRRSLSNNPIWMLWESFASKLQKNAFGIAFLMQFYKYNSKFYCFPFCF